MERREFLESGALGLGGLAMASGMVASAPAAAARESAQTKTASPPVGVAGESTQTKAIDTIREWDPAKAEAYLKVNTNPWTNGVLDIKTIELILRRPERRLHQPPAGTHTPSHQGCASSGRHPKRDPVGDRGRSVHGDPCVQSRRADAARGRQGGREDPTAKKVATPAADMMKAKGLWNTAWDPFFGLDPLWTDQFFAAVGSIYDGKTLQPKFVELLSIALDASVTHMYAPGTRRHINGALALGATMEEIMETLKIATSFGQETINMAIPILGGNCCIREEEIVWSLDSRQRP